MKCPIRFLFTVIRMRIDLAKPFAGMDIETTVRLRWVMRDIRARRTKFWPVSERDLTQLVEMGFVDIDEEGPMLTNTGLNVIS